MVRKNRQIQILILLLSLAILPVFFYNDRYIMNILILCFIWSIVAASWDLILGYANVFSFGHIAFFVIGGYSSGLLVNFLKISPWIGILVGGIIASMIGLLIGLPCLKLKGIYLAIVTFSLLFVLPTLIVWAGPGRFKNFSTGGTYGLQKILPPSLFGYTFTRSNLIPWYYLTFVFFITFLLIIYKIIHSSTGLALVALRDAEPLAKTLGINDYKYKLLIFGISSFIAGIMGALYAHYFEAISPANLGLNVFLITLVMVLFGGLGVFPGAVLGSFVINFTNELLRPLLEWRLVVLGAIVIITMILMPKGLMGIPELFSNLKYYYSQKKRWGG